MKQTLLFILIFCSFFYLQAQQKEGFIETQNNTKINGQILKLSINEFRLINQKSKQTEIIKTSDIKSARIGKEFYRSFKIQERLDILAKEMIKGEYSLFFSGSHAEIIYFLIKPDGSEVLIDKENAVSVLRQISSATQNKELVLMTSGLGFSFSKLHISNFVKKLNKFYFPGKKVSLEKNNSFYGVRVQAGIVNDNVNLQYTFRKLYVNALGRLSGQTRTPISIYFEINPDRKVSFETGLFLDKLEMTKDMDLGGIVNKTNEKLYYINNGILLPFNLKYKFSNDENEFFGKVGINVKYQNKRFAYLIDENNKHAEPFFVKRNVSYGINAGFGYIRHFGSNNLGLEYRFTEMQLLDGVTNVGKSYSNGLYLSIGHRF